MLKKKQMKLLKLKHMLNLRIKLKYKGHKYKTLQWTNRHSHPV